MDIVVAKTGSSLRPGTVGWSPLTHLTGEVSICAVSSVLRR